MTAWWSDHCTIKIRCNLPWQVTKKLSFVVSSPEASGGNPFLCRYTRFLLASLVEMTGNCEFISNLLILRKLKKQGECVHYSSDATVGIHWFHSGGKVSQWYRNLYYEMYFKEFYKDSCLQTKAFPVEISPTTYSGRFALIFLHSLINSLERFFSCFWFQQARLFGWGKIVNHFRQIFSIVLSVHKISAQKEQVKNHSCQHR